MMKRWRGGQGHWETRDKETQDHSVRVMDMTLQLAQKMHVPVEVLAAYRGVCCTILVRWACRMQFC